MHSREHKCMLNKKNAWSAEGPETASALPALEASAHTCGGEGSLHQFAEVLLHLHVDEMQFL